MPIKMNCPACAKPYTLADSQAGKRVRCRNCAETFTVVDGDSDIPTVEFADNGPVRGGLTKAPRAGATVGAPRLKPRNRDEDDRPVKDKGGSMVMPLVIGGIVLFFLLLLGGGGLMIYFVVARATTQTIDSATQNQQIVLNTGPLDGSDLRTPEEALERIQGSGFGRKEAADWLARQSIDPAKQNKVAQALEKQVNVETDHFTKEACVIALGKWATKDQLPTLMRVAETNPFDLLRGAAMDAIVRLKDMNNINFILKHLDHGFSADRAKGCLITLGKDAQGEVLKWMDHPNAGVRTKVQDVLFQYRTPESDKIRQAIADLSNPLNHPTGSPVEAANFLAKVQVIPEQQQAVTRSLEGLCKSIDPNVRNAGLTALTVWCTAENIPTLAAALDNPDRGFNAVPSKAIIDALMRFPKEASSARALTRLLTNHFEKEKASQALKNMGPAAEDAVLEFLRSSTDHFAKVEALKIIGAIGTQKSIPVLTLIAQTDRGLQQDAIFAGNLINSRPK
jgi:HEAT repeat protein